MTENKPIAPTLRGLKVGQTASFPIRRMETVRVTVDRLNATHRGEMKWSTQRADMEYNVTRVV